VSAKRCVSVMAERLSLCLAVSGNTLCGKPIAHRGACSFQAGWFLVRQLENEVARLEQDLAGYEGASHALKDVMEAAQGFETAEQVGEPWQSAECRRALFEALARLHDTQNSAIGEAIESS
jgi:hypothetical protein